MLRRGFPVISIAGRRGGTPESECDGAHYHTGPPPCDFRLRSHRRRYIPSLHIRTLQDAEFGSVADYAVLPTFDVRYNAKSDAASVFPNPGEFAGVGKAAWDAGRSICCPAVDFVELKFRGRRKRMAKIGLFYGSTTGNTLKVAELIIPQTEEAAKWLNC